MSNKTNEEKLKILQERLATIQQKKETDQEKKVKNQYVAPVFEEELVNDSEIEPIAKTQRKHKKNSSFFKYFIGFFVILIVITLLSLIGFYGYKNIDFNSLLNSEKTVEKEEKEIIYSKSKFGEQGNFIIILNEFEKEELANAEVQHLINKGFSCDVFYLPGVSDANKKVFQTYIGPFNKKNEAYQYLNSLISPKGLLEDETEKSTVGTIFELQ
tara:strand:- start:175 stop:816 length:642 start_codon:yes stop_codon:yes gene_type:complete